MASLICVTSSQNSTVSSLQRSLVPLLGQQTRRQGAKKHLGFTGAQHNILETLSLLPGEDIGRHRAEFVLRWLSKHVTGKTPAVFQLALCSSPDMPQFSELWVHYDTEPSCVNGVGPAAVCNASTKHTLPASPEGKKQQNHWTCLALAEGGV